MKLKTLLYFTCLLLSSTCYAAPQVGLSEDVDASQAKGCTCNDISTDECCQFNCADLLDHLNIRFDVDGENATFEPYEDGKGYRVCPDACEVVLAGKCKAECPDTPTPPTPTPTPEDSECNYYRGNIYYRGYAAAGSIWDYVVYDTASQNLSCLTEKIHDTIWKLPGWGQCPWSGYFDDCVAIRLTDLFFGEDDYVGKHTNGSICNSYDNTLIHHIGWNACANGEFYLDKDCNVIEKPENAKECGNFYIQYLKSSPISLILEDGFDINSDVKFVNFNLNPAKQDSWFTWKASEKAPLLVYDPEHTGKVTSAYQLFGEWTFGGKQTASLVSNENYTPASRWENGYEALASLDRDFDGKLQGSELQDLALWFDSNRDAISQEGEVITLDKVGIKTLFFNGYKKDIAGDLRLDVGFERKVDGTLKQGASIDWYGKGAPTKLALIDSYNPSIPNKNSTIESHHKEKTTKAQTAIDASGFRGVWRWFVDGSEQYATPDGYLILGEGEAINSIEGRSLSERIYAKSPDNKLHSSVGLFSLNGSIAKENGKPYITFSINNSDSINETVAHLSDDGKTLLGKTTISLKGTVEITSYTWHATREELRK